MNRLKKVYFVMHKISCYLSKIISVAVFLLVLTNIFSVTLQIFNRRLVTIISSISFPWTEELSRYSLIWLSYLALPMCFREGSMTQLDIVYSRLGKKGRFILYAITRLFILVFSLIVIKFGWEYTLKRRVFKSTMLAVPGIVLYSIPVISSLLILYELITEVIGVIAGEIVPFNAGEKRSFPEHMNPTAE